MDDQGLSGMDGQIYLFSGRRHAETTEEKIGQFLTRIVTQDKYIIWSTDRNAPNPTAIQTSFETAKAEALRLTKYYNKEFHVMKMVASTKIEVKFEEV